MTPTTLFCSHTCEKYYSPVHNHPKNEVLNELHLETAWPFLWWWSLSRGHSTYRWTVVCLHISYLQVFKKEQYKFKYLKINLQLMKKNLIIFAAAKSTSHFHHTNAVFLENGQYKEMHYIFENTSCFHCFRQKSGKPKTGKPKLIMAVKNYSLIKIYCILIGVLFFHGLPNIS